jgi:hypothetical protein
VHHSTAIQYHEPLWRVPNIVGDQSSGAEYEELLREKGVADLSRMVGIRPNARSVKCAIGWTGSGWMMICGMSYRARR